MREIYKRQFQLGQASIDKIQIDPKSRDDIPAVLKGLQHIWCDEALRARLFELLDRACAAGNRTAPSGAPAWTCGGSWCWPS